MPMDHDGPRAIQYPIWASLRRSSSSHTRRTCALAAPHCVWLQGLNQHTCDSHCSGPMRREPSGNRCSGETWEKEFDIGWIWHSFQLQLVIVWCIMLDCEQPNWLCHARPGYNDTVNEAFKVGCNSCILSMLYLKDTWQEHELGNSWFVHGCSTMKLFATHVMIYHDISRILHNSILLCLCPFCGCCKQNSMQACKGHTFHAVITSLFSFKAFIGGW